MTTYVPAKKNTAYITYVGLVSQANPSIMQVNPTLASGDVKIAIDDGAPANLATLPVVDADFTKRVKVSLSAAEMNGDNISIIFSDAAGDEWCDLILNIQTAVNQIDDIPSAATIATAVLDGTVDEATVGANPTTLRTKTQAIWNRLFTKRTATEIQEVAYESNNTTIMETWTLGDDDTTTSRTP